MPKTQESMASHHVDMMQMDKSFNEFIVRLYTQNQPVISLLEQANEKNRDKSDESLKYGPECRKMG